LTCLKGRAADPDGAARESGRAVRSTLIAIPVFRLMRGRRCYSAASQAVRRKRFSMRLASRFRTCSMVPPLIKPSNARKWSTSTCIQLSVVTSTLVSSGTGQSNGLVGKGAVILGGVVGWVGRSLACSAWNVLSMGVRCSWLRERRPRERYKAQGSWPSAPLVGPMRGMAARRQLLLPVSDNYFCRCRGSKRIPPTTWRDSVTKGRLVAGSD
jgi:hypothetical protein